MARGSIVEKYWGSFCFGHCPGLTTYLESKSGLTWVLPKFFNAFLRGIAQVVFANNPWTGLLVMIGIYWYNWSLGGIVTICTSAAIVFAMILKENDVSNGLISFNAVLLASVTVCLWEPMYDKEVDYKIYTFIVGGSLFSIFLYNGLSNLLSSFRPPIPVLSAPFHVLIICVFVLLKPEVTYENAFTNNTVSFFPSTNHLQSDFPGSSFHNTAVENETFSWETTKNIMYTLGLYSSQIFGFPDIYVSLIIYGGMLLYSPILTLMCIYGGLVTTLTGLFLTPFPNDEIFNGVYGFNGFLAGGAITLNYLFNKYSVLNTTADAIFTGVLQATMAPIFAKYQLPVFGLPFLLSTFMFISITGAKDRVSDRFVRLGQITFPEMDRKMHFARRLSRCVPEDEEAGLDRNLMDVDATH